MFILIKQRGREELPSSLTWTLLSFSSGSLIWTRMDDSLTKQPFLATYRKIVSVGSNEREIFPCFRVGTERHVWESKEKRKWGGGGWFTEVISYQTEKITADLRRKRQGHMWRRDAFCLIWKRCMKMGFRSLLSFRIDANKCLTWSRSTQACFLTLLSTSSLFLCFSLVTRGANCCNSWGLGGVVMSRKYLKAW